MSDAYDVKNPNHNFVIISLLHTSVIYLSHDFRPLGVSGEYIENIAYPPKVDPEVGMYTFFIMNHDQELTADAFELNFFVDNVQVLSFTGKVVGDFSNGKLYYWEYLGNKAWPKEQCVDSPDGWYYNVPAISEGMYYRNRNCAFFALDDNCADYGKTAFRFGRTANQACCACGGGTTGVAGVSKPVSMPTLAPSIVPNDCVSFHRSNKRKCFTPLLVLSSLSAPPRSDSVFFSSTFVQPDVARRLEDGTCDTKVTVHCGKKTIPTLEKLPGTTLAWPLENPVTVLSREDTTVTFHVTQNFKLDGPLYKLHIMYPTDFGELCMSFANVEPGAVSEAVTATCTGGVCSPVRVYVSVNDPTSFGNSTVFQSELCEAVPDPEIQGSAGFLVYMACDAICANTLSVETTRLLLDDVEYSSSLSLSSSSSPQVVPQPQDFGHVVVPKNGFISHNPHRDLQEDVQNAGSPFRVGFETTQGTFPTGSSASTTTTRALLQSLVASTMVVVMIGLFVQ
jgi:hypothetical protein